MDINQVIEQISGHLAVENEIEGVELLQQMTEEGIKPSLVAQGVLRMKKAGAVELQGEGLSLTKNKIVFVKEYEAPAPEISLVKTTPTATEGGRKEKVDYGYDIQVNYWTKKSYKRKRTAFDGFKIELPPEYQDLKSKYQEFSSVLTEKIPEFNGAGEYAIAILNENPELAKFENKDGNVFYRWNSENVKEIMDKYYPVLESVMKEEVESEE